MNLKTKTLNDINKEAILVLNSVLGIANTIRFLGQFTTGYGNYTEEKEKIFENMSLDDIIDGIKAIRQ